MTGKKLTAAVTGAGGFVGRPLNATA